MGTWGAGILQNDIAQDGMCFVARKIEQNIEELPNISSETNAAKLGAAVGLLLQFSFYSFNPENDFNKSLLQKLRTYKDDFSKLPGKSGEILQSILAGKGEDLASQDGILDEQVEIALHSEAKNEFPVQKAFSTIEDDLFTHPAAQDYLQTVVDNLVKEVDEGFQDEEIVDDLSREGEFMGAFSLLLIIPKAKIAPQYFQKWQAIYERAIAETEIHESEQDFYREYNSYVRIAFDYGIKRYSV